jgi:hypothetical protein
MEQEDRLDSPQEVTERVKWKASEAKELLNHPILAEFFKDFKAEAFNKIYNGKPEDWEQMKVVKEQLDALKQFEYRLQRYIEDGKMIDFDEKIDTDALT